MNAKRFISTTGRGIARAERNGSDEWTVTTALADRDVRCLAADPLNPNRVYAGTQGDGILRSDDGGKIWKPVGMAGQIVKAIAASPHQPGLVYAGGKPPVVFVSEDCGESWVELGAFRAKRQPFWFTPAEPGDPYVQAIALSPSEPGVILAGVEFGAVLRSEDGGETWSDHRRGAIRDCHTMTFHASDGGWVYESGGGGSVFSDAAGRTWRRSKGLSPRYGWACAADPAQPEVRYASVSPGPFKAHGDKRSAEARIFRARGDAPWEALGGGLPEPLDHMPYALLTDRSAPGELYAGLSNGDIWHSADQGDSWRKLPVNVIGIHRSLLMWRS
jgi:photosystem II stability/assembly factor-like uncharacterized protein